MVERAVVLADEVRRRFEVDDTIVTALPGAELASTTSLQRSRIWRKARRAARRKEPVEFLVPRLVRKVEREWPSYLARSGADGLSAPALAARVEELGPWRLPYRLHHRQFTMTELGWRVARERILFRRDLIASTVATLLGESVAETTVLDLGCNSGFFSLELASHGAHVDGIDLRPENIAQAQFLASHFDLDASFSVSDVKALETDRQWDVVFNLGLLYHVTEPLELLRQTYDLCRRFAVIDTKCDLEPVSAFLLLGEKDVDRPTEGRLSYELHPTYRGAIDTIRYAGFSEVIEIVGLADPPHPTYASGTRRCFLAIK